MFEWFASTASAGSFCLFCENGSIGLALPTLTSVSGLNAIAAETPNTTAQPSVTTPKNRFTANPFPQRLSLPGRRTITDPRLSCDTATPELAASAPRAERVPAQRRALELRRLRLRVLAHELERALCGSRSSSASSLPMERATPWPGTNGNGFPGSRGYGGGLRPAA